MANTRFRKLTGKATALAAVCLTVMLSLWAGVTASAQSARTVKGTVVDTNGDPVAGAAVSVTVNGKTDGALTDGDGKYTFRVPAGARTMEVMFLGYTTETVTLTAGQDTYNVVLHEDSEFLEETVIVAFGKQKKETVTGAVSMVQTKELVQSPQANVSNILAGRLPGLLAVQRSGEPGEDFSTIRIRGVGTFASGEGSQEPLVMVDGIETTNYNNIDPNEIESLSILKDASSTAVYGVRGANGVILSTTKRGNEGKPKISYSGNVAVNKFTDIRETMNAYEYATNFNEAQKYDAYITGSTAQKYSAEAIQKYKDHSDPIFYPDVNWYDEMLRELSTTTQHNINVSGGTKDVKYFVSAGYYNQQGLFKPVSLLEGYDVQSAYERFNFRSNTDFKVTDRLTVNINIASQMETRTGNAGETGRLMEMIARTNPMETPGVVDGKIVNLGSTSSNPLVNFYENGYRNDYRNNLTGAVGISYDIPGIKGLKATAKLSYENYYRHLQKYAKNPPLTYTVHRNDAGELVFQSSTTEKPFSYSTSYGKSRRTYIEAGLNYATKIANAHNITALLLYNQSRKVDPGLQYKVPNSYQGIVGRVTYDFKNRYLAEVNIGYNGTENFAPGKRFGFFPAYSLGWVISEEPFFKKNDVVSFVKIRGSYGEVGNDRIGGNRFLYLPTTYGVIGGQYYFGNPTSNYVNYSINGEGVVGNEELTWERARKANVGAELTFWKSHIRIEADFFMENRDNILANRQNYAAIYGATPPPMNFGKMSNRGFDGDISFTNTSGSFSYWLKANYTYPHNTIEYLDEIPNPYPYKYRTGQILGQYFGLICDGFYNTWEEVNDPARPRSSWNNNLLQPGDLKYRDINGDGVIDSNDEGPIGYSNFPEVTYGFSLGGDWKGLDFSVLFQGAAHVSLQYSRMYTRGFGENFAAPRTLLNSWSQERYDAGLPIEYPHLSVGDEVQKHNYQSSTFWTRDASYLRLKNIEVGYTVDTRKMRLAGLSSARIFVNGNNIYTWSHMLKGVDPEAAQQATNYDSYPITKTFNIGLTLTF